MRDSIFLHRDINPIPRHFWQSSRWKFLTWPGYYIIVLSLYFMAIRVRPPWRSFDRHFRDWYTWYMTEGRIRKARASAYTHTRAHARSHPRTCTHLYIYTYTYTKQICVPSAITSIFYSIREIYPMVAKTIYSVTCEDNLYSVTHIFNL